MNDRIVIVKVRIKLMTTLARTLEGAVFFAMLVAIVITDLKVLEGKKASFRRYKAGQVRGGFFPEPGWELSLSNPLARLSDF